MEKHHRSLLHPVKFMESGNNEQQQTDKLVKKVENKRKRKRTEPLEVFKPYIIIFTLLVQKYLSNKYLIPAVVFKKFGLSVTYVSFIFILSLQNQFDSPMRREKSIEKKVDILESNQQLILKKIDMLTNFIKNMRPSLPNPCQLKPTLPGQ